MFFSFFLFFFLRRDSHGRAHGRVTEERKRSRATRDSCDPIRASDAKSASGRSLVGEELRRSEMSEGTRVLFSQIQRTRSASFESDFFPSISSRRRNGVRCSRCPDATFSRIKCHGARLYTQLFTSFFAKRSQYTGADARLSLSRASAVGATINAKRLLDGRARMRRTNKERSQYERKLEFLSFHCEAGLMYRE